MARKNNTENNIDPQETAPPEDATVKVAKPRKPRAPKASAEPTFSVTELMSFKAYQDSVVTEQRRNDDVPMETLTESIATAKKLQAMIDAATEGGA